MTSPTRTPRPVDLAVPTAAPSPAERPVVACLPDGVGAVAVARAAAREARRSGASLLLVVPRPAAPAAADPLQRELADLRLEEEARAVAGRALPTLEAIGLQASVRPLAYRSGPARSMSRRVGEALARLLAEVGAGSLVTVPGVLPTSRRGLEDLAIVEVPLTQVVGTTRASSTTTPRLTAEGRRLIEERIADLRSRRLGELRGHLMDRHRDERLVHDYARVEEECVRLERLLAEADTLDADTFDADAAGAETLDAATARPAARADDQDRSVQLGSLVVVETSDGRRLRLRPVDPAEAWIDEERISVTSPVARAILGRRAGESVLVHAPAGTYGVRVLEVLDPAPADRLVVR